MAINYDKIWQTKWGQMQEYGPTHRHHRRIMLKLLEDIDFKSVLDVGCGNAVNLSTIAQSNKKIERLAGLDISDKAIEIARDNLPQAVFYNLDIQKEKVDKQFDLVICFDVLEHLSDDIKALKNISEMSKKYFLVETIQGRMRNFEKQIGHIRNYQKNELIHKIKKAGFRPIKIIEWGFPFYSPLYRNLLDTGVISKKTEGKANLLKVIASHFLYFIFQFNKSTKGDIIYILAEKKYV